MAEKSTDPHKGEKDRNELSINYLALRKYIGILGISLPIILLVGSCVVNDGVLEDAISEYFHTRLREFFTIILGGMSLLLFAYRGYDSLDKWITNIAGAFGLLTAFISTGFESAAKLRGYSLAIRGPEQDQIIPLESLAGGPYEIIPDPASALQSTLHLVCAVLFFLLLAIMAYFQFTKAGGKKEIRLYKTCAWVIFVTIVAMAFSMIPGDVNQIYQDKNLLFWGETICLWAFGISWLAKGIYTERRNEKV